MTFRFLHTADWQLGKQFGQVAGDSSAFLRSQRNRTVKRVAEIAAARRVDAVLVAGDIFENNAVSNETIWGFFDAIKPFEGPWIMLPGNHDAATTESVWMRIGRLGCPNNLVPALTEDPILLRDGRVAVLPAPLLRKHEVRDLTEAWNWTETGGGVLRIGLAHGSVENHLPDGAHPNNPISPTRDQEARMDYIALGDWHGTRKISERIWYSGTPEPDGFRENDPGNVLLVELDEPGARPLVEKIRTAEYAWHDISLSILGIQDLKSLEARLSSLPEPAGNNAVSLTISGGLDLTSQAGLDQVLSKWRSRLLWLREDTTGLVCTPTDEDLDKIDVGGFVRSALDELRSLATGAGSSNAEVAQDAMAILYELHMKARQVA
jgi:DNA repair exonuclease SbcCD nuclease subunit